MSRFRSVLLPLLVVLTGIAGRAVIDKMLALQGGAEAIATYAQLSSLSDLVSSVSLAGIGVALVAAVARAAPHLQFAWLRASLFPSLALSGIAVLAVLPFMDVISGGVVPRGMEWQAQLAILVGWLVVATTLVMSFLIGTGRPGWAVLWTAASFLPPLAALVIGPFDAASGNVLLGQGVFGSLATIGILVRQSETVTWREMRQLIRFAPAGIAIGILSPVSMLLARTRIADASGWELVAQAQAVWRVNDWVQATAGGLLYIYFLPRLSAAATPAAFWKEMKRGAWTVVLPAGLVTSAIWAALPYLAAALYRQDMVPTRGDAALMLFGDWLRVVAWLFLYGLYARHAARAVTIGEFCSVPLFALILWFSILPNSLAGVGAAWAIAYCVYAVFNGLALREAMMERLAARASS